MKVDDYELTTRQLALLDEVLELTWQSGSLVEIVDFRAGHPDDRVNLDKLVTESMLARDGHGIHYRVDILGLDALRTPRAKLLIERGDILARELKRRFLDKALRNVPCAVGEIARQWGVGHDECTLTLQHFKDILHLFGAGLVSEIGSADGAVVAGERILDCPSMDAVISQLREWRRPKGPLGATKTPVGDDGVRAVTASLVKAWPAVRACLQAFSFNDIKEVAGLAGLDLTVVAHLDQKPERGATKGQLMTAIDAAFGKMQQLEQSQFLTYLVEEILRRRPESEDRLSEYLSRHGWSFSHGTLSPIRVLDPTDLPETPEESHQDLLKAAQRFRDGDLSGAISAACGAVDSATARVYQHNGLGDPAAASFQERCRRAATARGVIPQLEEQLRSLGWSEQEIVPLKRNYEGALNQGAYVMQSLRSKMGDVHGSKPILKSLVFDCIKWAELVVSSLLDRTQ